MHWFYIELEIPIFGKDGRYVNAENQSDAEFIAVKKASEDFKCSSETIQVVLCKKIN